MIAVWIIIGLAVVLVAWLILTYNSLVTVRNEVDEAWSDIDVQLKRRHDLIPNLINSVKGYVKHEAGTFEKITALRSEAMKAQNSGDMKAIATVEKNLQAGIMPLLGYQENYPDLKADSTFLDLQAQLTDTENKVQASRRFYNGNVKNFNTKLQVFPTNIIAGMFKFVAREFFGIEDEAERAVPEVKF